MAVAIVTGSTGLVGSEVVRALLNRSLHVVGIDNDSRAKFFGPEASTVRVRSELKGLERYTHLNVDIRTALDPIFHRFNRRITLVVHCAAQPSHDWAAGNPIADFDINARSTLLLLEAVRAYCMNATVVHMSTNKVYGDAPNFLPLVTGNERLDLPPSHPYYGGIDEFMSIDSSTHSLFGVSKLSADLLMQEYGRYFGIRTCILRCGCLTGPSAQGAEQHGFLAYLMKCVKDGTPYLVHGYGGLQVRDNLHARDVASAVLAVYDAPVIPGTVYNLGGGRNNSCSVLEAIRACEAVTGDGCVWSYSPNARIGDHMWWITDTRKFTRAFPQWRVSTSLSTILQELADAQ